MSEVGRTLDSDLVIRLNTTIALGLAVVVALLSGPLARADDWATGTGGNARRDGYSREVGPDSADQIWQGSRSSIITQQAVVGFRDQRRGGR